MQQDSYNQMHIDHHSRLAAQEGLSVKALSWGSERSQRIRFRALEHVLLSKSRFSVLDMGCGFGDFNDFLLASGYSDFQYAGLDVNPEFVREAGRRHPDANFICGDLARLMADRGEGFDYIVASGIYNLGQDPEAVHRRICEDFDRINRLVKIGYGVNFLSTHSDTRDDMSIYYDPAEMLNTFCDRFGRFVRLYHDYLPHDFTLIMHRNQLDPWPNSATGAGA